MAAVSVKRSIKLRSTLDIKYNNYISVQYNCNMCNIGLFPCSQLARKCEIRHWFPRGADGWSAVGVRSRDYQIFSDG